MTTKIATNNVTVETERFELAHGEEPKGEGYWGFGFGPYSDYEQKFMAGSYDEAKSWAVKYALQRGLQSVTVLS